MDAKKKWRSVWSAGCRKVCIECDDGYYLTQSYNCVALPENCVAVTDKGVCTACEDGYALNAKGECCPVSTGNGNNGHHNGGVGSGNGGKGNHNGDVGRGNGDKGNHNGNVGGGNGDKGNHNGNVGGGNNGDHGNDVGTVDNEDCDEDNVVEVGKDDVGTIGEEDCVDYSVGNENDNHEDKDVGEGDHCEG